MLKIDNPGNFKLPSDAYLILQQMFPGYQRIVIKDDFSALGYSGSWVYRVHLHSNGPELPVVVKIASVSLIEKEWQAYQRCVQNQWLGIAQLRGQPVIHKQLAGLCYSLMGGGVFAVKSLREYCLEYSVNDITFVLRERFFQIAKKRILLPSHIKFDFPLRASYDAVLPVNLFIEAGTLPTDSVSTWITPDKLPPSQDVMQIGSPVRVSGFIVTKVNLHSNTITVNLPSNSYRLHITLPGGVKAYRIGEAISPLDGFVIQTRQSCFYEELKKIFGSTFNPNAEKMTLSDGLELPNPLLSVPIILAETRHLKFNCIHGDLNLENFLVDPHVRDVRLIDFADARSDHVLHDFLHLEMEIVTKLIPNLLVEFNQPSESIIPFYEQLHGITFHKKNRTVQLAHKLFYKPYKILIEIRQAATEGFYDRDDFSEYYQGLTLYLLGALRFKNLGKLAKQVAFWAAATIQKLRRAPSPSVGLSAADSSSSTLYHKKRRFSRKTRELPMLPAKAKIYQNLPQPDYGRFIGRENELAKVAHLLRPYPHSRYPLIAINGIGGIGKSVLALEIAHRYRRHYERIPIKERFEAIIWISAKQTVLTAEGIVPRSHVLRTLDEIYNVIAVTLQREEIIGTSSEIKAEKIRHALTQQRTLLIVDNLETIDDEAVLDFLRELPAPTKAIITTRHWVDVAYPVRLVGMPWKNAKVMIAQECQKKDVTLRRDEAYHLYDRTAGVPLAIVWSVAQMGSGHEVKMVLTRLGEPNTDIARFCFEGSMKRIHEKPAHKLLMALSLFVTDASREALGQITNLPELDRDDGLVRLEKLSLIHKSSGRFALLPLTKSYAIAQLKEKAELESELQLNMIHYFLALSRKLKETGWDLYHLLDQEAKNIQLVMEWAYQWQLWREFGEFVNNLIDFWHKRGLWYDLVEYAEMAVELGDKIGNKRIIMNQKLFGLGWIKAIRFREFDEALKSIEEGQEIAIQLKDQQAIAGALRSRGVIYRELGQHDQARELLRHSLKAWRGLNDPIWEIRVLGSLAENEWKAGNLNDALSYCTDALQKSNESEVTEQIAINLRRLSEIYQSMGRFKEAFSPAQDALKIFEKINVISGAARCHLILAELAHSLGRIDEAKAQADRAYKISQKSNLTHRLERAKKLLERLNEQPSKP